jgi:hypothetical protein
MVAAAASAAAGAAIVDIIVEFSCAKGGSVTCNTAAGLAVGSW